MPIRIWKTFLLHPYFTQALQKAQPAWRKIVITATQLGIPVPAFSTPLAYYDGYRSERLPANDCCRPQRILWGTHLRARGHAGHVPHRVAGEATAPQALARKPFCCPPFIPKLPPPDRPHEAEA